MKKRIFSVVATLLLAFMLSFTAVSCSSCSNTEAEPVKTDCYYDYDAVVTEDYDYIASQYQSFRFLEADAVFDGLLSEEGCPNVISIRTVFQVGDTCIMIWHDEGDTLGQPRITKDNDHWMECMNITARTPINLDSALKIAAPYRSMLNTRKLTYRRMVGPPFPKHAEYIFGNGMLFVDAVTGEIRGTVLDEGLTGSFQGKEE